MTTPPLPGWRVEPWQVHPRLRRLGYALREDLDHVYLIYGVEELVATFKARDVTIEALEIEIDRDIADRNVASAALDAQTGYVL